MGGNLSLPKGKYCDMLHVRDNLVVTVIKQDFAPWLVGRSTPLVSPILISYPYWQNNHEYLTSLSSDSGKGVAPAI